MRRKLQITVEPRPDGRWAVQTDVSRRAASIHDRKIDAVQRAHALAQNKQAEVVIRDENGQLDGSDVAATDTRRVAG